MHDRSGFDEDVFQTLLEQVRDLHSRTGQLRRSKSRIHENIRARLSWNVPPSLADEQLRLADEVVEVLGQARLSRMQSRKLYDTYFGR
jgi:hypothetical protein